MSNLEKIDNSIDIENGEILISVNQVSKKFCRNLRKSLVYGVQDIAKELLGGNRKSNILRPKEFWALHNINFQLKRGEALGLVGSNGAGKSTILRIISGLIKPDTGVVKVRGKVAPLIALGAGFNPILSGRENIYANMSILGLSTLEIQERFEEVVDFSGIGDAIDAPVQSYSSGMAARLGFACAVHIQPDILLIDEVLAVGDIQFRIKCYKKLAELREKGTAFILVAHNPHVVLNVCESSIYIRKGELIASGDTESVIRRYEADLFLGAEEKPVGKVSLPEKSPAESLGVDIVSVEFQDEEGNVINSPICGQSTYLCIQCKSRITIENANVGVLITALSGQNERILYITSTSDNQEIKIFPGNPEIKMYMPYCCLLPGLYSAKIYIKSGISSLDIVESFRFAVESNNVISQSLFYQPRKWTISQNYDLT